MSLKRQGKAGGIIIVVMVLVTVLVTAIGVNKIRIEGETDIQGRELSDFIADILPPPQFVVEPFSEASMIMQNPDSLAVHKSKLHTLKQQFQLSQARWRDSPVDTGLKQKLLSDTAVQAEKFFDELDRNFLPAAGRRDQNQMVASYQRLTAIFQTQRAGIEKLSTEAAAKKANVYAKGSVALNITVALLATLFLSTIAMVTAGIVFLNKRALNPLSATAETMSRMAGGELDVGKCEIHRDDEIGQMTLAIEVFRKASKELVQNETKQRDVVNALSIALARLSEGDLSYRINKKLPAEYEKLRSDFNASFEQMSSLIKNVTASAESVASGANEIRTASDDLSRRNEEQAARLEETSASMNQVTKGIQETAGNTAEMKMSIAEAHQVAADGGEAVERAVTAMAAIEQSSQEITQIIDVIDSIALQTNLLALNAGVEAARAGDSGKGFAVVANEVRALAQRSAEAASQIKELIGTSYEQVGDGVAIVGETGELLRKIVHKVGEISNHATLITEASEGQASNLGQVNSAVHEMDRMTQHNAAMVEQSTAAARSLADQAQVLSAMVSRFRTGDIPRQSDSSSA